MAFEVNGRARVASAATNYPAEWEELAAHTGLEPVISALRGQRVNQLHQCAVGRIIEAVSTTRKLTVCAAKAPCITFFIFPRVVYSAFAIPALFKFGVRA